MITEEMVLERVRQNRREALRAWRAKNRDRVNEYQRQWYAQYKEKTGMPYSRKLALDKARRELIAEMGE